MKRFIVPSVLALFSVVAIGAVAHARGFRHGGHDPEKMKAFVEKRVSSELDELKATDEQRKQILGIVDGFVDGVAKGHDAEHTAFRESLAKVVESGDGAQVDLLIDEHAARKTAIAHDAVKAGLQIRAVLTPEQRTQLAQDIREHKGWQKL